MQITLQFGWPSVVPGTIIVHPEAAAVQMDIAWPEGNTSRCLLQKTGDKWSWNDPSVGIHKQGNLEWLSWNWNLGAPGLGHNDGASVFHTLYTVCMHNRVKYSASPFIEEFLKDAEALKSH